MREHIREHISSVCESLITKSMEGQSRRNNLVVDGIAEYLHETWMESEDKVREINSENLKTDHRNCAEGDD